MDFSAVTQRLDKIEQQLEAVTAEMAKMNTTLALVNQRHVTLSKENDGLTKLQDVAFQKIDGVKEKADKLEIEVVALSNRGKGALAIIVLMWGSVIAGCGWVLSEVIESGNRLAVLEYQQKIHSSDKDTK